MKWWHFARPGVSFGGSRATEALWEKCEVVGSVLAGLTYIVYMEEKNPKQNKKTFTTRFQNFGHRFQTAIFG